MKTITCIAVVVASCATACFAHASQRPEIISVSQTANPLFEARDDKEAMDEAIRFYLEINPPEIISATVCQAIENNLPPSLPESAREKALKHIRENVTADIMKRMISDGLKRNFTVEEVGILSKYDELQFSDELKRKNEAFKFEISSKIRMLLAATI